VLIIRYTVGDVFGVFLPEFIMNKPRELTGCFRTRLTVD